jgi:hypothetical protein
MFGSLAMAMAEDETFMEIGAWRDEQLPDFISGFERAEMLVLTLVLVQI